MTTDRTSGRHGKTAGRQILLVETTDLEDESTCSSVETTVRSTKRHGLSIATKCKEIKTTNRTTKTLGLWIGSTVLEDGSTFLEG